jgi:hypothetical protein
MVKNQNTPMVGCSRRRSRNTNTSPEIMAVPNAIAVTGSLQPCQVDKDHEMVWLSGIERMIEEETHERGRDPAALLRRYRQHL